MYIRPMLNVLSPEKNILHHATSSSFLHTASLLSSFHILYGSTLPLTCLSHCHYSSRQHIPPWQAHYIPTIAWIFNLQLLFLSPIAHLCLSQFYVEARQYELIQILHILPTTTYTFYSFTTWSSMLSQVACFTLHHL